MRTGTPRLWYSGMESRSKVAVAAGSAFWLQLLDPGSPTQGSSHACQEDAVQEYQRANFLSVLV